MNEKAEAVRRKGGRPLRRGGPPLHIGQAEALIRSRKIRIKDSVAERHEALGGEALDFARLAQHLVDLVEVKLLSDDHLARVLIEHVLDELNRVLDRETFVC